MSAGPALSIVEQLAQRVAAASSVAELDRIYAREVRPNRPHLVPSTYGRLRRLLNERARRLFDQEAERRREAARQLADRITGERA